MKNQQKNNHTESLLGTQKSKSRSYLAVFTGVVVVLGIIYISGNINGQSKTYSLWSSNIVEITCEDNQVVAYSDVLSGTQLVMETPTTGDNITYNIYDLGLNDAITSIEVGKNARVVLCYDTDCSSTVEVVGPYKSSYLGDWNDEVSKIITKKYDSENKPLVTVFGNSGFDLDEQAAVFGPGSYIEQDLLNQGLESAEISSLIVPSGLMVVLYQHDNFLGDPLTILGPVNYDITVLNSSWDDSVKSMKVIWARVQIDGLNGYWKKIAMGNGPIEMTVYSSYQVSDNDTAQFNVTLSPNLTVQIDQKTTTNSKYFQTIQKEFIQSKNEQSNSATVGCSNLDGSTVVAYQWQIDSYYQTSTVYSTSKFLSYVCKYGSDATEAPSCPSGFCVDSQCSTCLT